VRTTLTIDEQIAKALKALAHRSGKSFKQVLNETLRAGLVAREAPPKRPYRIKPASLGGVLPGVDLTKALQLAASLEDEEIARKLELRK
jgi:hypothetical protein